MGRGKGLIRWWCLVMLTLLLMHGAMSSKERSRACAPSRCGIITNISHPFRLPDDPPNCGDSAYELACENNVTLLHLSAGSYHFPEINYTYHVLAINYNNFTIRLLDPGIQEGNCSFLPRNSLFRSYFTYYMWDPYEATLITPVLYLNCSDAVRNDAEYVDTAPCVNWESKGGGHIYAVVGDLLVGKMKPECHVESVTTITSEWGSFLKGGNFSYADIHRVLSYGFEVSWWQRACDDLHCSPDDSCSLNPHTQNLQCKDEDCYSPLGINIRCGDNGEPKLPKLRLFAEGYLLGIYIGILQIWSGTSVSPTEYGWGNNLTEPSLTSGVVTGRFVLPFITARFLFGMSCLFALLIYTCRRRHLSIYENIEDFLQLHNLIPIRYSYKELKKMTKGFKNKLGEGGFGIVYKGKLSSGPDVAIKMLGKSKANCQEFISEVATIGRIHHFNVVRLVGFCVEGRKHALVYEFMSNGSLDKHIFSKEGSVSLNYGKIYEISLGVARGIAYLHHGCDMKILHFDIKPHNILLDDNFIPKVSDFGLARLYPVNDSIITLTAARGTIGYMAPELFYKNIGGVSYKADVYSFGMLLMEMASQRRNLNPHAEHSSQLYFPLWIYDQFNEEKDIEMEVLTKEEKNLAKKMFIVALWCIQLKPVDRPSMNKVIEMLEADDVESLEMPPKPSLYPNEIVQVDDRSNSD